MKVLIMEFHQESNSFLPYTSQMDEFECCYVLEGDGIPQKLMSSPMAISGMLDVLHAAGAEVITGYAMSSPAGSIVDDSVVAHFLSKLEYWVEKAGPVDALLLSLHGATQATGEEDVCGAILQRARELVGSNVVISASFDLHANITGRMFTNADFMCGYQTYPHVDRYETGARAAQMALRKLRGEKLTMAWARIPILAPASGYTTQEEPFSRVISAGRCMQAAGDIEDFSVFQMQPWLDVADCGGAAVVIAKTVEAAREAAMDMAKQTFAMREAMMPPLVSIDEALERARRSPEDKTLVVVDFADSPNAGAAGDSARILGDILQRRSDIRCAFALSDEPAVEKAFVAGVGARVQLTVGATRDPSCSKPVEITAAVKSLHDGQFFLEGPAMRGLEANAGRTAVLRVGNIDVVVFTKITRPGDLQMYRHFGVEPKMYDMVVVKANTSFKAGYASVISDICYIDTECAATANLKALPFQRVPQEKMYPFSTDVRDTDIVCQIKNEERGYVVQ